MDVSLWADAQNSIRSSNLLLLYMNIFLRWDQNNGLLTWFAGGICQCQQNWRGEHHFREKGPSAIYTHAEMDGLRNDVNAYLIHSLPADSCVISTNDNKRQVLSRLSAVHDFSHFDMFYRQLHGLSLQNPPSKDMPATLNLWNDGRSPEAFALVTVYR